MMGVNSGAATRHLRAHKLINSLVSCGPDRRRASISSQTEGESKYETRPDNYARSAKNSPRLDGGEDEKKREKLLIRLVSSEITIIHGLRLAERVLGLHYLVSTMAWDAHNISLIVAECLDANRFRFRGDVGLIRLKKYPPQSKKAICKS